MLASGTGGALIDRRPSSVQVLVAASILAPLALALQVLLGAPSASPVGAAATPAAQAQAPRTDASAVEVTRLQRLRSAKLGEKRALERTYEAELGELDRLKRGKPSWRRDREIRGSQADSQTTAERLSRADQELRAIDASLRRQRQALIAAIDREVVLGPSPGRRAQLGRLRGAVAVALAPRVRKILVPDDTLDELADPDQLAEQVALIQQAEAELRRERESLRQREDRYTRMARLREQRERATQLGELEDDQVRRTGGRGDRPGVASEEGGVQDDVGAGREPPGVPGPPGDGPDMGMGNPSPPGYEDSAFTESSILLSDVVDAGTLDALRRAGRSASPRARADAAARARKQVEERLQRFERNRALILRHLGRLRQGQ